MNGPDHYREAEINLTWAAEARGESNEQYHLAVAQVHATLALAAATALPDSPNGTRSANGRAWLEVAGTRSGAPVGGAS